MAETAAQRQPHARGVAITMSWVEGGPSESSCRARHQSDAGGLCPILLIFNAFWQVQIVRKV